VRLDVVGPLFAFIISDKGVIEQQIAPTRISFFAYDVYDFIGGIGKRMN